MSSRRIGPRAPVAAAAISAGVSRSDENPPLASVFSFAAACRSSRNLSSLAACFAKNSIARSGSAAAASFAYAAPPLLPLPLPTCGAVRRASTDAPESTNPLRAAAVIPPASFDGSRVLLGLSAATASAIARARAALRAAAQAAAASTRARARPIRW
eukprot:15904-Pelagococcus_subviridis.AAC.1